MSENKMVMAIDFGTTNTYITLCPSNARNKTVVKLDGQKNPEICTTLLYSDLPDADTSLFPLIGDMGTQTFSKANAETIRAKKYRYASHFKPLIAGGGIPRQNAIDFFQTLLRDAATAGVTLLPLSSRVIIGVPCEANQAFQNALREVAAEAGFGKVELMEEARGALLNDVGLGLFPLNDLLSGYLTIDFGGGTCDYAFMRDGRVTSEHCWGDMGLGGKLFDDLFFQWFCEQNPGKEKELIETGKDFLVRTFYCREAKEDFSRYINKAPNAPFDCVVGRYGEMKNLTQAEFLRRTKYYSPSESFKQQMQKINQTLPDKLCGEPIDLVQWFKDSLTKGMEGCGLHPNDVYVVSLAGGSSLWFFVKDICAEYFPQAKRATNPNPFAAISEGLAILPALQADFEAKQKSVLVGKKSFVENEIRREVQSSFEYCRDQIVGHVLAELFDDKIKPVLLKYRDTGGTIASMKKNIDQDVKSYELTLTEYVQKTFRDRFDGLFSTAIEKAARWLKDFGLNVKNSSAILGESKGIRLQGGNDTGVGEKVINAIALIIGTITAAIVASICGGTGAALIMAGPIGLLIGAILAAVVLLPAYLILGNKSQEYVEENLWVPAAVLYFVLTDASITNCREKMEIDLKAKLDAEGKAPVDKLVSEIDHLIQHEINQLNIINLFS